MGPDCGTAIIGGVPLAFANVVPRGDIGIIGASGTGIQEISCLIAKAGRGVSHAIGTGGRDLKKEIGGITTLMAIDLLDADPATKHMVIVSKPPAADVAKAVLVRVAKSAKPFTICFLGAVFDAPANAKSVPTLEAAAVSAAGGSALAGSGAAPRMRDKGRFIRGLYTGGTLCAEAQVILLQAGNEVSSNVAIPGAKDGNSGHSMIDLGDDEFTRGRPHPMIEPAVRDAPLLEALRDPETAIVLIDCVLGFGGHDDPAGHLAGLLKDRDKNGPPIIASVTGTEGDPQRYSAQVAKLSSAGIIVEPSNAAAVRLALKAIGK
jgi:FdrA protein